MGKGQVTVRDFLRWWIGQLKSCLPDKLRDRYESRLRGIVVTLLSPPHAVPVMVDITRPRWGRRPPQRCVVTLQEGEPDELGTALGGRGKSAVTLRLPGGMVLQRHVVLPIAADRSPREVLHFELDRLTPFRPDEVLWDFVVTARDRQRGRLHVVLTLAPLAPLRPLIEALHRCGAAPVLVEAASARIRPNAGASAHRRRGPRLAWAFCTAVAIAVMVVPFVRQYVELRAVDARIDALRPAVAEADALRHRDAAVAAGGEAIQAERSRIGDPLRGLAAVTDALPDDTWLADLTLHQRKLLMAGESQDAVRLIGRLSAEQSLRNPSFTAPVTRKQSGHGDLFSVGVELEP